MQKKECIFILLLLVYINIVDERRVIKVGEREKLEQVLHTAITTNPAVKVKTKIITLDFCEYDLDVIMSLN
jgi:hypothetical protein